MLRYKACNPRLENKILFSPLNKMLYLLKKTHTPHWLLRVVQVVSFHPNNHLVEVG